MKLHDSSKVGLVFVVAFFCASLSHSSAQSQDTTPPILTAFSLTPTTINISAGQAVVAVNWSATDELSGVSILDMQFVSPSGTYTSSASSTFHPPALSVSATANAPFPQFSETG